MLELLIFLFYLFLCYLFSLCFVFVFFFFVLSLAGVHLTGGGGGVFISHLVFFIGRSGSGFFFANLRFSVVFFLSFLYLPSR